MRPMIVITTRISTSVKPSSRPRRRAGLARAASCRTAFHRFLPPIIPRAYLAHLQILFLGSLIHPTTWLTDISAVMTETIRPPTMMLMAMIAPGPAMPTSRSRLR